jgi:hypothetical protein
MKRGRKRKEEEKRGTKKKKQEKNRITVGPKLHGKHDKRAVWS